MHETPENRKKGNRKLLTPPDTRVHTSQRRILCSTQSGASLVATVIANYILVCQLCGATLRNFYIRGFVVFRQDPITQAGIEPPS